VPDSVFAQRPALRGHDGQTVIVGIRPEDLEDASLADPATHTARMTSDVTLTEALGSEIVVHFALDAPAVDAGDPDAVDEVGEARAIGRFDPRSRVRMREPIDIAINVDKLHFFHLETRLGIWA